MNDANPSTRLLIFEPNSGGHHAGYVEHVVRGWMDLGIHGNVVVVCPERLLADRPSLAALASDQLLPISFEFIPPDETVRLDSLLRKGLRERRLLKRYVERFRPDDVLAMFMDHTQAALATRVRMSYPARISGLMLRVSHHRGHASGLRLGERITRVRKRLVLQAAVRNPHAGILFSADPSVIPAVSKLSAGARAALLPDPVPLSDHFGDPAETRQQYGVEQGRKVLLLFGVLAERKGVLQVIEALHRLPESLCSSLTLILAGPVETDLTDRLPGAIEELEGSRPVQVILRDEYLFDDQIDRAMGAADLIIAPYLGHSGTSSVLIRAAGARQPALVSDFGLMAEQVREHRLGQVARMGDPGSIAESIERFVRNPSVGFDPERAREFARTQTPRAYAKTLFRELGYLE